VLLIAAGTLTEASIVAPYVTDAALTDTTIIDREQLRDVAVDLFNRSGESGHGRIARVGAITMGPGSGCVAWPSAVLTMEPLVSDAWHVGLAAGRATVLPLDSIDVLSGSDSARVVADITRLASALPDDTADTFRGLPFVIQQMRRFAPVAGVEALVAELARRISVEAAPREERLFLLAERRPDSRDARYQILYHERDAGPEDTVEAIDVLAALRLDSSGTPILVRIHDVAKGNRFSVLERESGGVWRLSWMSAYAGC
jgi:hypothetical protein